MGQELFATLPESAAGLDGVAFIRFSKRFGPMQGWDVDQIEILRGPQTANVGRNALAGAVVVNTNGPVFRSESAWRMGVATDSTWEAAGGVNAPVDRSSASGSAPMTGPPTVS